MSPPAQPFFGPKSAGSRLTRPASLSRIAPTMGSVCSCLRRELNEIADAASLHESADAAAPAPLLPSGAASPAPDSGSVLESAVQAVFHESSPAASTVVSDDSPASHFFSDVGTIRNEDPDDSWASPTYESSWGTSSYAGTFGAYYCPWWEDLTGSGSSSVDGSYHWFYPGPPPPDGDLTIHFYFPTYPGSHGPRCDGRCLQRE